MSIKIASMNFGDCDTILHNTTNGMKNIAEVLGPNGEVYWNATKELTGIPPLSFTADGTPLLDYLISGNMSQSGTPTPDNPVIPQGTGEMTGNLWEEDYTEISGSIKYVPIFVGDGTFTLSTDTPYFNGNAPLFLLSGNVTSGASTPINGVYNGISRTTDSLNGYITIAFRWQSESSDPTMHKTMLNLGSTALPYEPYGYKIPISSGGENLFPQDSLTGRTTVVRDAFNEIASSIAFNNGQYVISMNIATEPTTGIFKLCFTYTDDSQDKSSWITKNTPTMTLVSNSAKVVKSISITDYNNFTDITLSNIMLNRGSTALPYEPYIEPTETNIYLGEVETTRQIKKLVLDGTENWITIDVYYTVPAPNVRPWGACVCTHCAYQGIIGGNSNTRLWVKKASFPDYQTLEDFKSYLAQQYANGTPVTVWYSLATPETGIVNEPIRKIGDYADTVSYEQAGVDIPTNRGNTVIDVLTELKPSEMYIKYK